MSNEKKYSQANDNEFFKNRSKRNPVHSNTKNSKVLKVIKIILIILLAITLVCLGVYTYFRKIYRPDTTNPDNPLGHHNTGIAVEHIDSETGTKNALKDDVYTFLATGCDKSGSLTDVIMIVSYDFKNQKVAIMSIPRDTYVKISSSLILDSKGNISKENFAGTGTYATKINGVYAHGRTLALNELERLVKQAKGMNKAELNVLCDESFLGIDANTLTKYIDESDSSKKKELKEKIRKEFGIRYLAVLIYYNFGVPCDFYASVNISGFRNIVDAIDGVDVYVPERMYYRDPYQDLYIDIPAGNQHLDGKKAEEFVRFRSGYYSADIGRIEAQKIFMTAFIKKLCSPQIVTKIGDIVEVISENLTTNLSVSDAMYFATHAIEIDLSNIVMLTLPGASQYVGNVSYYLADKEQIIQTVNSYLNKYSNPLTEEQFCIEVSSTKGSQAAEAVSADNVSGETVNLDFVVQKSTSKQQTQNVTANNDSSDNVTTNIENTQSETTQNTDNSNTEITTNQDNDSTVHGENNSSDNDGYASILNDLYQASQEQQNNDSQGNEAAADTE